MSNKLSTEYVSHCKSTELCRTSDKPNLQTNDLWKFALRQASIGIKHQRISAKATILAGAAFLILRGSAPEGEWGSTLAARTDLHRSTVNRWMNNVNNLLDWCGISKEERVYQAIISTDPEDSHVKAVHDTITNFIDGKSATQLELSIRAQKKVLPAHHSDTIQDEREYRLRRAEIFVGQVEDIMADAPHVAAVFDEALLNRFNAALKQAYAAVNKGFTL